MSCFFDFSSPKVDPFGRLPHQPLFGIRKIRKLELFSNTGLTLPPHQCIFFAVALISHLLACEISEKLSLRSLHEHVVHAPWLDSAAIAPQSLPPAHEMMHALRDGPPSSTLPANWDANEKGQMWELSRAKETIALMEQRLNQLIEAKTLSPVAVDTIATAVPAPLELRRDVSQSETVYALVEELKAHLETKFSFEDSDESAAETSQDSFQMGGPATLWRELHTLAHDILSSYNDKLMTQAVSRGNSRDPSPRNGDTAAAMAASTGSFGAYIRLSSESGDMPLLGASTESLRSHVSGAQQHSSAFAASTTLDQIVAMAERDMQGVDTSFDSLNSQESPKRSVLKPIARLPAQASLDDEGQEIEDIVGEPELSCSKEEDSGFWNVSAASIDPCLSDESFDIMN